MITQAVRRAAALALISTSQKYLEQLSEMAGRYQIAESNFPMFTAAVGENLNALAEIHEAERLAVEAAAHAAAQVETPPSDLPPAPAPIDATVATPPDEDGAPV